MHLTAVFAMMAASISLGSVACQPARLIRTRCTAGISLGSQALSLGACSMWVTYGLTRGQTIQIVVNVPATLGALFAIRQIVHHKGALASRVWTAIALWALTLMALNVMGAWAIAGTVATAIAIVSRLPQAWLALRRPGGFGLSTMSFVITTASCAVWTGYGGLIGDPFVVVTSVWVGILCLFIAVRTSRARELNPQLNLFITAATSSLTNASTASAA